MNCAEDRKNIRKFRDDLLDEAEYQRVRKHVESCVSCAQLMRVAGSISSLLMEMGRAVVSDELVDATLFLYEKKRKEHLVEPFAAAAQDSPALEMPQAPILTPKPSGISLAAKAALVILVFLVGALAWRDWVQTHALSELASASSKETAPAVAPPAAVPFVSPAAMAGDFEWGNTQVRWPQGSREEVSAFIRRFSPDIRYEAPGLLVVHVTAEQNVQWQEALSELTGAEWEKESAAESSVGDRLYTISYRKDE